MTQSKASTPCPKCGKMFACCLEQGGQCWCASVKLSPDNRSYLASNYDGCLCPGCLKQIKATDSIRITLANTGDQLKQVTYAIPSCLRLKRSPLALAGGSIATSASPSTIRVTS